MAGVAGLGLAIGFAMGAAQVVPTLAYVQSSYRLHLRQTQQIEGMAGAEQADANRGETVRLAYPLLLGTEQEGSRPLTDRGLHEGGANGFVGATMLLATPDLDATFERLQARDVEVVEEPTLQPYGVRDCAVRDPAGNLLRIQERG